MTPVGRVNHLIIYFPLHKYLVPLSGPLNGCQQEDNFEHHFFYCRKCIRAVCTGLVQEIISSLGK